MTHYLDLGFLLCLVTKAPASAQAWELVRALPQPLSLTAFQAFQVENGLRVQRFTADPRVQAAAAAAAQLWHFYIREMVFVLERPPWEAVFDLARQWNERTAVAPPPATFLLHPALAAALGCTHFLSFEPRSRALAQAAGLKVLPRNL